MSEQKFQHVPKASIRAAAILTNSYVAGTTLEVPDGLFNQLVLLVDFTKGSLTTAEVKVEFASNPDGDDFYQETFQAVSTGTATETLGEHAFGATGKYRIVIPIKDRFIKVSAKGTGTVTSSSMALSAVLGVS